MSKSRKTKSTSDDGSLGNTKSEPSPLSRKDDRVDDEMALDEEDLLTPAPVLEESLESELEPEAEDEPSLRLPSSRRQEEELPSSQQTPPHKLEKVGRLAALVLVPLVFLGVFYIIFASKPTAGVVKVKAMPELPIEGKLLKIETATTGWRDRTEADRVSSGVGLITKETVYPSKLPEIRVKFASGVTNGFLRVLFLDSEGKIAGDPRVVKVVNGKVQASGQGDNVIGDLECSVAASTGLLTERHLGDYFAGDQKRWSVEISESADYKARGDEWKLLDTFNIADTNL